MAVRVRGAAVRGVEAVPIEVEVDLLRRLPGVCIVGLAAGAVRESSERVRSAVGAAGCEFPRMRVVVNLAPAGIRKDGAAFDLPIAVGLLTADNQVDAERVESAMFVGELALDGLLRPVPGAVALGMLARKLGKVLILPASSACHAALVPGVDVRAAMDLGAVVAHLRGEAELPRPQPPRVDAAPATEDLRDVRGQLMARRALEIAAAGAHHLLLIGPPGCGKSMLARRLPTILPPLAFEEVLDVVRVHGATGSGRVPVGRRPFRAPHASVTVAGMIGDRTLRPGEVSLAHHGVLFLDEVPEFRRGALEALRAPLEDGTVQLTRAEGTVRYPAQAMLVMAANPCPCGMRGSVLPCTCNDTAVRRYFGKLSGPLLDRVDLHVTMQPVTADELLRGGEGETSQAVRERVTRARARQQRRDQSVPNGRLPPRDLTRVLDLTEAARRRLHGAAQGIPLSGRAVARVSRVARTVADLAGSGPVDVVHLEEALAYRPQIDV